MIVWSDVMCCFLSFSIYDFFPGLKTSDSFTDVASNAFDLEQGSTRIRLEMKQQLNIFVKENVLNYVF